jgi:hypothetical protein
MNKRQFTGVLVIATLIASMGSHLLATRLKVKTTAAQAFTIGEANGNSPAFLAGSSVADYGIEWQHIATQINAQIKVWGIAGSKNKYLMPGQLSLSYPWLIWMKELFPTSAPPSYRSVRLSKRSGQLTRIGTIGNVG